MKIHTLLAVSAIALASCGTDSATNYTTDYASWSDYGGSADAAQYSSLEQVNRSNVANLKVAWSYETGDENRYFFAPLVSGNLAFVLAKNNSIVALNAATGEEIWTRPADPGMIAITNRGINYWESDDGADRRILYAADHFLIALNAETGAVIESFGSDGRVNLKEGLGRDPESFNLVQSHSPGRVFENLIILGSATNEGYGSAPGDVRAYDARTGALVWNFHTIPHPGEFGYDTWPEDAWKTVGGANVWTEFTVDVERGVVYLPVASAKYNFYGADRAGANLFSNSLVAVNARTGERIWHFQFVHHDIWDYDPATAPKLLTVQHEGREVDVVAQASKQGFLFVFDRDSGEPLWPIEERPVPTDSEMPRETLWPTQPFPTNPPPFARQSFSVDDMHSFYPEEENVRFRKYVAEARNEGLFTPPGRGDAIQMPGNNGGANWGGAAVEPDSGRMYIVSKALPAILRLDPDGEQEIPAPDEPALRSRYLYDVHCHACHSVDDQENARAQSSLVGIGQTMSAQQLEAVIREGVGPMPGFASLPDGDIDLLVAFLQAPGDYPPSAERPERGQLADSARFLTGFGLVRGSNGLPPIKPPWSTLTAYDLNKGVIDWQIPLGEVPFLAAQGITGTGTVQPKVGPVATAGGLIFTGTRDKKVRAFDASTGEVLWEHELDAAMEGIPAVYELDGKQYILFCASAQAGLTRATAEPLRGAYVAFALED